MRWPALPPYESLAWDGRVELGLEVAAYVGARHGVVHEAAAQHLRAVALVHHLLEQRLADALAPGRG